MLCLCGYSCSAQINAYQVSLVDSNEAILYCGFSNVVHISGLPTGAVLHFTGATAVRQCSSQVIFQPHRFDTFDTLVVLKGRKKIFSKAYRLDAIPDPKPAFGILRDSAGSVNQIDALSELRTYLPGCHLKYWGYAIISFDLEMVHRNSIVYQMTGVQGSRLPQEALEMLTQLRPGDKLHFREIRATCPDCRLRNLGNFTITIR